MKIKRWSGETTHYFYNCLAVSFFLSDTTFYIKKDSQELSLEVLTPRTKNLEAITIRRGNKEKRILK